MLKRLFTPGRTQAFDKEIAAGWDNNWVPFEGSNYGLPMEPGTYVVTLVTDGNVQLQSILGVNQFKDNSYNWVKFTEGVAVRLRWESLGELRFRCSSAEGGFVTVLVTPVTNSLSLSLVEYAAAWLRWWQHGAKAHRFSRPGGVHSHRQRGFVGYAAGFPRPLDGIFKHEYSPLPRPLQGGNFRAQLRHDLQCVPMVGDRRPGNSYRLPGDPRIRRTPLFKGRRHCHHHQACLTSVGGGC